MPAIMFAALGLDKRAASETSSNLLLYAALNLTMRQIAALLDRSFPQERDFMFWNIVITHLLAVGRSCPRWPGTWLITPDK